MKRYRLSFDVWGLLLFLLVMLPNFIWFAVPAPDDILREEAAGGLLEAASSVFQVLLAAALCFAANREREGLRPTPPAVAALGCVLLYYAGWLLYYAGLTGPPVILLLTVPPCLSFLFFAAARKNWIALVPGGAFALCHLAHGVGYFL